MLTDEEVRLFRDIGYLKLGTLPDAHVEELRDAVYENVENEVEPVVRGEDGTVGRISNVIDRGGTFTDTIAHDRVIEPLAELLGPNIVALRNRHNHATLRRSSDRRRTFHRDVSQWSRPIVTVLFYLTETTLENGCTWVVPGSQFVPPDRDSPTELNEYREFFRRQAVPVPMEEGGMLVIDSLVVHAAGVNTTDEPRPSMTIGYHSADELSKGDDPNRVLVRGEHEYKGNDD